MNEAADAGSAEPKSVKLNVLALPSYTAILFALITLVVLGAGFASLLPGSQLWWPPIVIGLTVLPLRDFLRRPAQWMRRQRLARIDTPDSAHNPPFDVKQQAAGQRIQDELIDLAHVNQAQDTPAAAPVVAMTPKRLGVHTFGTSRQRYIGISEEAAVRLASQLQKADERKRRPARTLLAHEFAHFANRDIWMIGLSYSLLKILVLVMLLDLWIGFALSLFIIQVGPEVLRSEFWQGLSQFIANTLPGLPPPDLGWVLSSMQQKNPQVFAALVDPASGVEPWTPFLFLLVSSHLPFIVSGLVLFALYWRRLLRVRELYADARAAELVRDANAVPQALALHGLITGLSSEPPDSESGLRRLVRKSWQRLPLVRPVFALHPSKEVRKECLAEPQRVFGSGRSIAISVGLAVVLLELILRGTLTAGYLYEPGAHLTFAAAFTVFAFWLLPQVCLDGRQPASFWRLTVPIVALFTAIKLVPYLIDLTAAIIMQATNPSGWGIAVDMWAYAMAGTIGGDLPRILGVQVSWMEFVGWHILRPVAYFALFMPPVLIGCLWVDAVLKRRALTWYRLEGRLRRVFFAITADLLLFLLLVIVPIGNRLFFPGIYSGLTPRTIAGMALGVALAIIGGVAFGRANRRLAGHCWHCQAQLTGNFELGERCPDCNERQHDWLVAPY